MSPETRPGQLHTVLVWLGILSACAFFWIGLIAWVRVLLLG
jgi:hypothetical protein